MSTIFRSPRGARAATLLLLAGLGASACAGGADDPPDARVIDARDPNAPDARTPCYSGGGTPTPGAEVELGVDNGDGFVVLNENDEIPLHRGTQGGFHVFVWSRIHGLAAGDQEQPPETNPATWFRAFTQDGEEITVRPCTYPLPYELDAEGEYVLPYPTILQIANRAVPDIYSQRMRITAEVMDGTGRYATDEQWVLVVPAEMPDASVPPPRPDAAVPDAGVPGPDAGIPDAAVTGAN